MPSVRPNETRDSYMARCVPELIAEGHEHKQAVAQCINMHKQHWQAKNRKRKTTIGSNVK